MDTLNKTLDAPMQALGVLLAVGVMLFFILNASDLNTLANSAGSLVKNVATA